MDCLTDSTALTAPVVLGNGRYRALVTSTGSGTAVYDGYLLTGWQDDPCLDEHGLALVVRDLADGVSFSTCGTPFGGARTVTRTADGVAIDSAHGHLRAHVTVHVRGSGETRTLTLTNASPGARRVEVTAVCDVVLNLPDAQDGHPAFGKLFVQTARDPASGALVATRRARRNGETHPVLALALDGAAVTGWETDRARWLGRGRGPAEALGLTAPLSGTTGNVLDPVLALRTAVVVPAHGSVTLAARLVAVDAQADLEAAFADAGPVAAPVPLTDASAPAALATRLVATRAARRLDGARVGSRAPAAPGTAVRPANGYGEFVADGHEYRIVLNRLADGTLDLPPMPWTNVLANADDFSVLVSEKGALTTCHGNSRLHRLTPWRNDPLQDPHDEAFFVRDEATGAFASLLPGPAPGAASYEVRHGFGYTTFRHTTLGLGVEATVYVPQDAPVRVVHVRLVNPTESARSLALYQLATLVQGGTPSETRASIAVTVDAPRGCVCARHRGAGVFAGRILFAAMAGFAVGDASTDRRAVLGCPGSMAAPRALVRGGPLETGLPGDAMAAQRACVTLGPQASLEGAFLLGEVADLAALDALLARFAAEGPAAGLARTVADWSARLGATRIATPVPALDRVVNGWLGYQTQVCRLWARSAYYQSGGAFGFRDQLQDASCFAFAQPEVMRAQILRNAAHQFEAGDVMHWWHPPDSVGMRTKFADDLVWLPYLTAHYLAVTGDTGVLDEVVAFRGGPVLDPDEDERYFASWPAETAASVYEHCVRALTRALTVGRHGLPLFGCGDWNDGMNRVGRGGLGESTFMGFFLVATIDAFAPVVAARGDADLATRLAEYRATVTVALNDAGWDGGWYRRGYYDSGTVLGSKDNDECRIDALAQAWAVISGVAPPARAQAALDALQEHLVSADERLVRLLTPAFVDTPEDPGYIKGYVAGVRENGGQYTHAALWAAKALLLAGRRAEGARLLEMLSPVSHAMTSDDVARYQVEPYVIAADVYGVAPHVGRGGWTWYTGSAGWMLRVTLENLLGVTVERGQALVIAPAIPDDWSGYTVVHRRPDGTQYTVTVRCDCGAGRVRAASLDGAPLAPADGRVVVPLAGDGQPHAVEVTLAP